MNFSYDDESLYEMHQTSCAGGMGSEYLDIWEECDWCEEPKLVWEVRGPSHFIDQVPDLRTGSSRGGVQHNDDLCTPQLQEAR